MSFLDSLERSAPAIASIEDYVRTNAQQKNAADRYARLKAALQVQEPGAPAPSAPEPQAVPEMGSTQPQPGQDPRLARLQATLNGPAQPQQDLTFGKGGAPSPAPPTTRDLRPDELTPAKMAELQNIAGKGPGDAIDNLLAQVGQERTQQAMIDRIKAQEGFTLTRDEIQDKRRIAAAARKVTDQESFEIFKAALKPEQRDRLTETEEVRNGQTYHVTIDADTGEELNAFPTGKDPAEHDNLDDYYTYDNKGTISGLAPGVTGKIKENLKEHLSSDENAKVARLQVAQNQLSYAESAANKDTPAGKKAIQTIQSTIDSLNTDLADIDARRKILAAPTPAKPDSSGGTKGLPKTMTLKQATDILEQGGKAGMYTPEEIKEKAKAAGITITDQ